MRFHIVRRTNGTGGFDSANINELVNRLNRDYLDNDISIQSVGTNFINSDALFDADGSTEHNTLFGTNSDANAINCYLVNSASLPGRPLSGLAQSIVSRNFLVTNDRARTSTSSHELGHCLNLLHTHETAFGVDAINGNNCSTAGDRVCDTRASPELTLTTVNTACTYTGSNGFSPDTRNIMAYGRRDCRIRFTEGQFDRMKLSLSQSSVLTIVVANNCQIREIAGDNCVCSTGTTTLSVSNLAAGIVPVWTRSSNILPVSSTANSITIRGQSGTRTQGTVTATFNGITLTKQVWVGEPAAPSTLSGPSTVNTGALVNYSSSDALGATNYEWRLPYPFDVVSQYNYSGQRWQMRQTASKSLQAFTGYAKTSGLVQVWGKNKCGNGGEDLKCISQYHWRWRWNTTYRKLITVRRAATSGYILSQPRQYGLEHIYCQ